MDSEAIDAREDNEMLDKLDFISGGLVNIILGALILWVGQTTFHHSGRLATSDEKFQAMEAQFAGVDKQYDSLRNRIDKTVNSIKDDSRTKFSTDDAAKLTEQIRKLDYYADKTEQRLSDRLTAVEVKLAALDAHGRDGRQLAALQTEIAELRAMAGTIAARRAQSSGYHTTGYQPTYQPVGRPAEEVAHNAPVYLPPVHTRR